MDLIFAFSPAVTKTGDMNGRKKWFSAGIVLAVAGLFVIQLYPVHNGLVRVGSLALIVTIWIGFLAMVWRMNKIRNGTLSLSALLISLWLLPGRKINQQELKGLYLENMAEFEGTRYYWGGEGFRGIDCSGLPRRAYRDALLGYEIRTLNGKALRSWAEQWWFDASARALGEGYRNYTTPLKVKGTIRSMVYEDLEPGDLAVTDGGAHILVYLGEKIGARLIRAWERLPP